MNIDQELNPVRTALNLRTYRQELLASNIANADTPYYKARDFDFKSAFANAMTAANLGAVQLDKTSPMHMEATGIGMPGVNTLYRAEYQGSVDGNTVNMDIERSAFAENSVQSEALLTFIRERVKVMNLALAQ